MGIDVQTLAGTIQDAAVTHHGTPDAVWKLLPGDKQLGALRAIQKAQGGGNGCGGRTGGMLCRELSWLIRDLPDCFWHPTRLRLDPSPSQEAQRVRQGMKCQWGHENQKRGRWGRGLGCALSASSTRITSPLRLFQKEIIWAMWGWWQS